MADGGLKSFESSINKGSSEDYSHTCDPCLTHGQFVEARGYCVDCQDYLCIVCYRSHSKNRASRDHNLLDRTTSVPDKEPRSLTGSFTERCSIHGREIVKFYCQKHEALACSDCAILHHKTCEIDYIPEKAVDFSKSKQCRDALENLNTVHKYATDVRQIAEKKIKEIDDAHKKNEKVINQCQREINDRVAELTSKCLIEAYSQKETKKQEISKVLKTCEQIEADLNQVKLAATNSREKQQDGQLFIAIKRAEILLESEVVNKADDKLSGVFPDTTFQRNKTIESLFNVETVLGKLSSARIPDFLCRTVRPAVISEKKERPVHVFCVGIDFGSTNFGAGVQFAHESLECKTFEKEPIAALFNSDQSLMSSNFQATMDVYRYDYEDCYFFESFMMELYKKADANETYIEDVTGKKMSAVKVLSTFIRSVKDKWRNRFEKDTFLCDDDNLWILTVPQRFHSAKQIMETAAKEAGIQSKNLTVAFESDAAFSYIQKLTPKDFDGSCGTSVAQFPKGSKYIVLDAGGKLVTTTLYEVGKNKSKQLLHAALDSYGGNSVNEEWDALMSDLLGKDIMERKKKENVSGYSEMMFRFNSKKHDMNQESKTYVNMTFDGLLEYSEANFDVSSRSPFLKTTKNGTAVRIDVVFFKRLYQRSIAAIINHLRFILQDETASGCQAIVMVGGYSKSSILCEAVREAFPHVKVMVPKNPDSAVLSGSLIMGFQ